MQAATLLIELAEKMGLLAAAALVAVLFPPLRNRVLGVGRRRDKLAAVALGLGLSMWGATLGFYVAEEHINLNAIGIFIAAVLGGLKAGTLTGLGGGLFYALRVDVESAPWVFTASAIDGVIAGLLAKYAPRFWSSWRTFATSMAIQVFHLAIVGFGLLWLGHAERYLPHWPAHIVKLVVNATGVTLFVAVARLVIAREEAAVALVEAKATADAAALEVLRRRLEPHFLFNALNALRSTIRTNPGRARELVADLADLYRYLLCHPEDAILEDEVNHARSYLAIERARLGDDRLRVEVDVAREVALVRVPALLLQPLVENAVKHGVAAQDGSGLVSIRAYAERGVTQHSTRRKTSLPWSEELDAFVVVEVQDASDGTKLPFVHGGTGIALKTLRQRLTHSFGERASLSLHSGATGSVVRIRLPIRSAELDESLNTSVVEARAS